MSIQTVIKDIDIATKVACFFMILSVGILLVSILSYFLGDTNVPINAVIFTLVSRALAYASFYYKSRFYSFCSCIFIFCNLMIFTLMGVLSNLDLVSLIILCIYVKACYGIFVFHEELQKTVDKTKYKQYDFYIVTTPLFIIILIMYFNLIEKVLFG